MTFCSRDPLTRLRHGRARPGHPRLWAQALKTWMPGHDASKMRYAVKPGHDDRVVHDPLPHPSPDAHALPQLSRGEPADARRHGGAGGTERRRQDQLHRGDLVSLARARLAARDAGRCRRQSGRRLMGGIGRGRGRAGAGDTGHRHRPADWRRSRGQPALPDRPRAGEFGHRVRRSPAHGVADAGDGRAVHGSSLGAAAVFRPAGAGDRQPAFQPGIGAGALLTLAQPPAGGAQLRRPLVRRDRARNRRACGGGGGDARPDRDAAGGDAARPRAKPRRFRPPRSCSTAGWKTL